MAKGKAIGITIGIIVLVALLGVGAWFFFTTDEGGETGALVFTGDTETLEYFDLTESQKIFLEPMLIKQTSGTQEKLIEGTFKDGFSGFFPQKDVSGYMCSGSLPISFTPRTTVDICQTFNIVDFTENSGGLLLKFDWDYSDSLLCSEVDADFCQKTGVCAANTHRGDVYDSFRGMFKYNVQQFQIENCHYEQKFDGIYTVYDAEPTFETFCNNGQVIENGVHSYTCIDSGQAIEKKVISDRFEVTAETFIQFNIQPVIYQVRIRDVNGVPLTPVVISAMEQIAVLSNGQVLSDNIEFLGNDLYEVTTQVSGVGEFISRVQFLFLGDVIRSPSITIDVRESKVNIETAEITPVADLGATETFKVGFVDSLGNKIDPDNIEIRVTFPDGVTEDLITFDEFTKLSIGEYEFSFTFTQIEKYTFDIIADKAGLTRGLAKASVSVSGGKELTAGPPILKYLVPVIVGSIVVFFLIAFLIFWLAKRRK